VLCTLLTDFGTKDHYVAALKAAMLNKAPDLQILDISHQIEIGDYFAAAFQALAVCFELEEGSLHFAAVGLDTRFWHIICQNRHFISNSTELLHLITNGKNIDFVEIVSPTDNNLGSFAARDCFCFFLNYFCNHKSKGAGLGGTMAEPSKRLDLFQYSRKVSFPEVVAYSEGIKAQVIYVDSQGNAITNIKPSDIDPNHFSLELGIESVNKLCKTYQDRSAGEILVFFNSLFFLEIAVVMGNASRLLGLRVGNTLLARHT
jgi:S-adenosylmethionine hydrolase